MRRWLSRRRLEDIFRFVCLLNLHCVSQRGLMLFNILAWRAFVHLLFYAVALSQTVS